MSLITENTADGDGLQQNFGFTFKYVKESDVKVTVNEAPRTLNTHYTFAPNTSSITFLPNHIPQTGEKVRIFRVTDVTDPVAEFFPGSAIRAQDLNTNNDQILFSAQERSERSLNTTGGTITGLLTMENADIAFTGFNTPSSGTPDNHETTLTVAEPTQDNTITLPNVTGTVVTTGDTDTVTSDMLTDNIDIAGTLDVTGNATFDAAVTATTFTGNLVGNVTGNADTSTRAADLAEAAKIDAGEQVAHVPNDTTYYTTSAADQRFWRQDAAGNEIIQTAASWTADDSRVATTGAIDARIIDLVEHVGGFVPIADETSFPAANPDLNDGAGTLVSIQALANNLVFDATGQVVITNGAGAGNNVTITGGPANTTIQSNSGAIVETSATLHQYTWHRVTPDATAVQTVANSMANVNTVAGSIANVNATGSDIANVNTTATDIANVNTVATNIANVNTVAGINADVTTVAANNANVTTVAGRDAEIQRLGTVDAVADMNTLGTAQTVGDLDVCANISNHITTVSGINAEVTTCAVNNANITTVANELNEPTSEITTVATNIANVNNVGNDITNVNTVANNLTSINDFGQRYREPQTTANQYTTNNDVGDLYFNTSSNELRVWNGTTWQAGVTAATGFASLSGDTFTGPIILDNAVDVGTPDISFDGDADTGMWSSGADKISFSAGGAKKFEIGSTGVEVGVWNGSTIAVSKGGTGQTSYIDGEILVGNTSTNSLQKAQIGGSGAISITNGNGSITVGIANATQSADGAMSSADKTKLDNLEVNFIETRQTLTADKDIGQNINAAVIGTMAIQSGVVLDIHATSKLVVLN